MNTGSYYQFTRSVRDDKVFFYISLNIFIFIIFKYFFYREKGLYSLIYKIKKQIRQVKTGPLKFNGLQNGLQGLQKGPL